MMSSELLPMTVSRSSRAPSNHVATSGREGQCSKSAHGRCTSYASALSRFGVTRITKTARLAALTPELSESEAGDRVRAEPNRKRVAPHLGIETRERHLHLVTSPELSSA